MLPRPKLETSYRAALAEIDPTRPVLASCAVSGQRGQRAERRQDEAARTSGCHSNYWYLDRERRRRLRLQYRRPAPGRSRHRREHPADDARGAPGGRIDEMWEYHCGRERVQHARALQEGSRCPTTAHPGDLRGVRAQSPAGQLRGSPGDVRGVLHPAARRHRHHPVDAQLGLAGDVLAALRSLPGSERRVLRRPRRLAAGQHRLRLRGSRRRRREDDAASPLAGVTAAVRVWNLPVGGAVRGVAEPGCARPRPCARVLTVPVVSPSGKACFVDARITAVDGTLLASSLSGCRPSPMCPTGMRPSGSTPPRPATRTSPVWPGCRRWRSKWSTASGRPPWARRSSSAWRTPRTGSAFSHRASRSIGAESGRMAAPILLERQLRLPRSGRERRRAPRSDSCSCPRRRGARLLPATRESTSAVSDPASRTAKPSSTGDR